MNESVLTVYNRIYIIASASNKCRILVNPNEKIVANSSRNYNTIRNTSIDIKVKLKTRTLFQIVQELKDFRPFPTERPCLKNHFC